MSKYVVVKFYDGDYRVYQQRVASNRNIQEWIGGAEVLAEGDDKDALIAMAQLAREAFLVDWPRETALADRTDELDFP